MDGQPFIEGLDVDIDANLDEVPDNVKTAGHNRVVDGRPPVSPQLVLDEPELGSVELVLAGAQFGAACARLLDVGLHVVLLDQLEQLLVLLHCQRGYLFKIVLGVAFSRLRLRWKERGVSPSLFLLLGS